ncbi:MAG: patatin-like phospholipase family protein, partial [Rudaea sp.]
EAVLLSSGEVETALLASTAIPVVFPHVELDGRYLVDGGVSNNTPIASAIALGAERILVLPTGMSCALREPPRNMAALALHVMDLQNMRQLDRDAERYTADASIVIVPPLCPQGVSVFDFSQTGALIERAAAQTRDWLDAGGLESSDPLHVPLAHHDRGVTASHGTRHVAA